MRRAIENISTVYRPKRVWFSNRFRLSPVIALEQRAGGGANPRSTVATVTEIADYARVLWAVCGTAFCPKDGGLIERRSMDDCLARVFAEPDGSRLMILAPWMTAKPAILREELPRLQQRGFQRVRLNGEVRRARFDRFEG